MVDGNDTKMVKVAMVTVTRKNEQAKRRICRMDKPYKEAMIALIVNELENKEHPVIVIETDYMEEEKYESIKTNI